MIHGLKICTAYFKDVICGKKTFEVRKNDRDFKVGDLLALNEYDPKGEFYTGNSCLVYVDYILDGDYCQDGYVIMSIKPCSVLKFVAPYNSSKMSADYSVPYATRGDGVE